MVDVADDAGYIADKWEWLIRPVGVSWSTSSDPPPIRTRRRVLEDATLQELEADIQDLKADADADL